MWGRKKFARDAWPVQKIAYIMEMFKSSSSFLLKGLIIEFIGRFYLFVYSFIHWFVCCFVFFSYYYYWAKVANGFCAGLKHWLSDSVSNPSLSLTRSLCIPLCHILILKSIISLCVVSLSVYFVELCVFYLNELPSVAEYGRNATAASAFHLQMPTKRFSVFIVFTFLEISNLSVDFYKDVLSSSFLTE